MQTLLRIPLVSLAVTLLVGSTTLGAGFVQFENLLLKPYLSGDTAFAIASSPARDVAFNHDLDYSPRITFGFADNDGFFGRVRYWNCEAGSTASFTPDGSGPVYSRFGYDRAYISTSNVNREMSTREDFDLDSIDLEAGQTIGWRNWQMAVGGGLRRQSTQIVYHSEVASESIGLDIGCHYVGWGPTLFAEFSRPAGYGISFFSNARLSLLFGEKKRWSYISYGETKYAESRFMEDDLAEILEIQLGLKWEHELAAGTLFASTAFETQLHQSVGWDSPDTGESYQLVSSQSNDDMGLLGANLSLGYRW